MAKKATTAQKENNPTVFVEATKTPQGYSGNWLIPSKDVSDALKIQFYDSVVSYIWDKESDSPSVSKLLGSLRTLINKGVLASPIGEVLPKEAKSLYKYVDEYPIISQSVKKTIKDKAIRTGKVTTEEEVDNLVFALLKQEKKH